MLLLIFLYLHSRTHWRFFGPLPDRPPNYKKSPLFFHKLGSHRRHFEHLPSSRLLKRPSRLPPKIFSFFTPTPPGKSANVEWFSRESHEIMFVLVLPEKKINERKSRTYNFISWLFDSLSLNSIPSIIKDWSGNCRNHCDKWSSETFISNCN